MADKSQTPSLSGKSGRFSKKPNTLYLAQLGILIAIEGVLALTPLGMIRIPPMSITTMHLPVIIAAILLGPLAGGIVGGAFGLFSMILAITTGSASDMLFSPAASGNPLGSVIMCILPRILLGVITAYLYLLFKKFFKKDLAAIPVAAVIGTALHTIMVMFCLYVFFSAVPLQKVFAILIGINCVAEMILAAISASAICTPLLAAFKKRTV